MSTALVFGRPPFGSYRRLSHVVYKEPAGISFSHLRGQFETLQTGGEIFGQKARERDDCPMEFAVGAPADPRQGDPQTIATLREFDVIARPRGLLADEPDRQSVDLAAASARLVIARNEIRTDLNRRVGDQAPQAKRYFFEN